MVLLDKNCKTYAGFLMDYDLQSKDPGIALLERNFWNRSQNWGTYYGVLRQTKGKRRPYVWIERIENLHFEHEEIDQKDLDKQFPDSLSDKLP